MDPTQLVESYRFWDVVSLWAREALQHEVVIAKALARGVIRDGLRMQSADPKWFRSESELRGYPYVGYCATPRGKPVILKADALEHLLAIVRESAEPSSSLLHELFVTKQAFRTWMYDTGQSLPSFWFTPEEQARYNRAVSETPG